MQRQQIKKQLLQKRPEVIITQEMEDTMIHVAGLITRKYGSGYHWYRNDSADMFQELFLKIWSSVYLYDPKRGASFKTFANAILENAAKDYVRKKKSQTEKINEPTWPDKFEPSEPSLEYLLKFVSNGYSKTPDQIMIEKEYKQEIRNIIQSIPEKYAEYLSYRFGIFENEAHDYNETIYHFHLPEKYGMRVEQEALELVRGKLTAKYNDKIIAALKWRKSQKWIFMYPAA